MSGVSLPARFLSMSPMGWWRPGDVLSFDFGNNRYMHDGTTVSLAAVLSASRTSPATWFTAAGVLQSFGPNVPAITDRGLYAGGQRVNKCTNDNANPVDLTNLTLTNSTGGAPEPGVTLTVVDDAGELAAAGLSGVCTSGKVYKLDNSAGSSAHRAIFGGTPGNTNLHALSCCMRGSGSAQLRFQGSTSSTGMGTQPLTSGYQRWVATGVPNATTFPMYVLALPGSVVYFILNQLEEGSFASPPIVTAGGTATRFADAISIPDFAAKAAAFGFGGGFAGEATINLSRLSGTAYRLLFDFGTDASNRAFLGIAPNNTVELSVKAASAGPVLNTAALGSTGQYTLEWQVLSGNSFIKVNGNVAASSSATFTIPSLTTGYIGHSRSGGAHLNDPLRELQLWAAAA